MSKSFLLLALLTLSSASSRAAEGADVEPALSRLTAASAEERTEAQRELTGLLRLSHLNLVTRAVLDSAEPELRWRLAEAIAGDGRGEAERLELASLLAGADPREGPRAVGVHALESLGLRWMSDARKDLETRGRTEEELAKSSLLRWSLDPDRTLGPEAAKSLPDNFYTETLLEQATDALLRHCGEGIRLVITPEATQIARDFERALARLASTPEDPERFRGSCFELVGILSERYGLELEGHGIETGAPLLLLRERREATVDRNLLRLLVRWARILQLPESSPENRRDAARALAASGWPAALEWLTWRAFERSDVAALDGVLLAAGRGVAVPQLIDTDRQQILLRLLEQAGAPKARIARALGTFPSMDAKGRPLTPALFEDYERRSAGQRFARLLAAERRSAREPLAVEAAEAELRRGPAGSSAVLALQALRTLAALGVEELQEETLGALRTTREATWIALASDAAGASEFAALCASFGIAPPARWSSLDSASPGTRARAFHAWGSWCLDVGQASESLLLQALRTLPNAGASWSALLRREKALGRADGALELSVEMAELARRKGDESLATELERAVLLAGIADRDEAARIGNLLLRQLNPVRLASAEPAELSTLGALVAGPLGREATELLTDLVRGAEELTAPQQEALVEAARRARSEFLAAGQEGKAQGLNTSLRLASGTRGHPLRRAFRAPLWPSPEKPRAISIESLERRSP